MNIAPRHTARSVILRALVLCLLVRGAARPGAQALPDARPRTPGTAYLLAHWPVVAPVPGPDVTLWCRDGGGAEARLKGVPDLPIPVGTGAFRIDIAAGPGAAPTDAQLSFTTRQALARGRRYEAEFLVRASQPVSFAAAVRLDAEPWTLLAEGSETTVTATPAWQTVGIPFVPAEDVAPGTAIRCPGLFLGDLPAGTTVWVADIALREIEPSGASVDGTRLPQLLVNPGFEEGTAGWQPQAADVTVSAGIGVDGSAACLVRERTARWGSPMQDIRGILAANGRAVYDFAVAVRKVRGQGEAFVVIHLRDDTGDRWVVSERRPVGDRGFSRPRAERFVDWTGTLHAADISVQTTGDDTADLVVDDVSLRVLEDAARGRPCRASTAEDGHEAEGAFDGDPATSWRGTVAGNGWLEADLGELTAFNGCVLAAGGRYSGDYEVRYRNGGWHTAFAGNDIRAPFDEIRFPTVSGDAVRLVFAGGDTVPAVGTFSLYAYTGVPTETGSRMRVLPPAADASRRGSRTQVGAIRWDGWCGDLNPVGLELERAMGPEKYRYRLPFYAAVKGPGEVEARCVTQATMDREIAFAAEAGIDYWAFDWYPPDSGLARARDLYLASERRDAVKWCVILATNPFSDRDRGWLIEQFQTPNYQCVLGDRPLVYVFDAKETYAGMVQALRADAARAGVPPPFIVLMGWSAAIADVADACGADGVGAYVNPLRDGNPFAANMAHEQRQWQALRGTGLQVVPTVTTGWDPRPFVDNPASWYPGPMEAGWVERATPDEVAEQLRSALAFADSHPEATLANSVLIYAWNENAEGGWIVPTLDEMETAGYPRRLDAVRGVLKPHVPRRTGWDAVGE